MIKEKTDEFWDVYNKDRERTGRTHRRGDAMKSGDYHLAVHVCIFNSKGELLIQQRQPFKKGWTNMWDITVGGSAVAGDSSCQAAEREVYEELGLRINLSHIRPRFTMNFSEGFDDYYIVEMDVDIAGLRLQTEEVKQVRFVSKEEALKMQEEGTMIPYWFLDKLFDIRGDYDAHGQRIRTIEVRKAVLKNLSSCMSMMEIVQYNFEPDIKLEQYQELFIRSIEDENMYCAMLGNIVIGLAVIGENSMPEYTVVHPEYRNRGVEELLKSEITRL